jgi:hypothetical protein
MVWLDEALTFVNILIGDIMIVIGQYLGYWRLWKYIWILPWFPLASALAALFSPVKNIIFLTAQFFTLLVPSSPATRAGSRARSLCGITLNRLVYLNAALSLESMAACCPLIGQYLDWRHHAGAGPHQPLWFGRMQPSHWSKRRAVRAAFLCGEPPVPGALAPASQAGSTGGGSTSEW